MCENEPAAWMWTMLVEKYGRRSTMSWPSLCETEKDAVIEATMRWGLVINVKGKEPLYYKRSDYANER